MNAEQASKDLNAEADLSVFQGRPSSSGEEAIDAPAGFRRGSGVGMFAQGNQRNTGNPVW